MENQSIFFNRAGSICTHAEEMLGTDIFLKITVNKATVNPVLTFSSNVMYINQDNKLKMQNGYNFQLAQLRNDEWLDNFINNFQAQNPDCKTVLGVLTSSKNIQWYINYVATELVGICSIDKQGQGISL